MSEKITQKTEASEGGLSALLSRVRAAQEVYATFSQEQVDAIFRAAATAANAARSGVKVLRLKSVMIPMRWA